MAESILTRHDLEARIVKHCWEDEAFRKEFLGDPAGAFVRYLQVPKDSLPKIVIHEETPRSWHIVLPERPTDARELSAEDLERVAGGTDTLIEAITKYAAPSAAAAAVTVLASMGSAITPDQGW